MLPCDHLQLWCSFDTHLFSVAIQYKLLIQNLQIYCKLYKICSMFDVSHMCIRFHKCDLLTASDSTIKTMIWSSPNLFVSRESYFRCFNASLPLWRQEKMSTQNFWGQGIVKCYPWYNHWFFLWMGSSGCSSSQLCLMKSWSPRLWLNLEPLVMRRGKSPISQQK